MTHTEKIKQWLQTDRLQLTRIHELLIERGISVSCSSMRRFCDRHGLRAKRDLSTGHPPRPALAEVLVPPRYSIRHEGRLVTPGQPT